MDDTFLIFKCRAHANTFLDYMNSQHPKIKFTMETENDNKLPFLDILVTKTQNNLNTSIYRKDTFSGLGVNYLSKCFSNFKNNAFSTMFYRAFRLTSSYEAFHNEIMYLKKVFYQQWISWKYILWQIKKILETYIPAWTENIWT